MSRVFSLTRLFNTVQYVSAMNITFQLYIMRDVTTRTWWHIQLHILNIFLMIECECEILSFEKNQLGFGSDASCCKKLFLRIEEKKLCCSRPHNNYRPCHNWFHIAISQPNHFFILERRWPRVGSCLFQWSTKNSTRSGTWIAEMGWHRYESTKFHEWRGKKRIYCKFKWEIDVDGTLSIVAFFGSSAESSGNNKIYICLSHFEAEWRKAWTISYTVLTVVL